MPSLSANIRPDKRHLAQPEIEEAALQLSRRKIQPWTKARLGMKKAIQKPNSSQ